MRPGEESLDFRDPLIARGSRVSCFIKRSSPCNQVTGCDVPCVVLTLGRQVARKLCQGALARGPAAWPTSLSLLIEIVALKKAREGKLSAETLLGQKMQQPMPFWQGLLHLVAHTGLEPVSQP